MDHTTANNGDEADEADSHIHEVVDDVELDSTAEEEPLTLDPSISPVDISLLSPLKMSSNTPTSSTRRFPIRPP